MMIDFSIFAGGAIFGALVAGVIIYASGVRGEGELFVRILRAMHEIERQKSPNATVRRIARILSGDE